MNTERRKFPRIPKRIELLANLVESKNSQQASYTIRITTENISKQGLMVTWPKGWVCLDCKNCVFWIFNLSCRLKNNNNSNGDFTKPLPVNCLINLRSRYSPENKFTAQVVWIDPDRQKDTYRVGLRFLEEPAQQLF